jgi:hypothetical protein
MKSISGIPAFEVEFDKSAKLVDRAQLAALSSHCKDNGVTDLILFAHGWNNDMADARDLSTRLLTEIGKVLAKNPPKGLEGRTFAAGLILWPSKKFTDEDLIPGGAAAVSSNDLAAVRVRLKDLMKEPVRLGKTKPASAVQQKKIKKATALLKTIATDEDAQEEFVEIIRSLLSKKSAHPDDGSARFFQAPGAELLQGFRGSVQVAGPSPSGGGAAGMSSVGRSGGAAGLIQDIGTSIEAGVRRFLNYTTYYQMKERAGLIGSAGVASMLTQLRKSSPKLRLHLVGHSFGGRVVTAATDAAGPATKVNSLTLLQAAYSHNGLSQKFDGKNDGFFRRVISAKKVMGPILATCTKNDRAVGIAYPLASRISGVNAAALGDENDPYGGIGRNGAVKTPEAVKATLQTDGTAYAFSAGKVFNLNADAVISGHSDICKPEVGWALLSAVATT